MEGEGNICYSKWSGRSCAKDDKYCVSGVQLVVWRSV